MVYDLGWDMPRINWVQQGSYEPGEIPPVFAPDDGPLVCLPPINQHWLPLVLGCLDQLRNPSTWIVANDDAMFSALSAANRLMQMFGERAVCLVPFELRVDGCELQYSIDGGTTFTTVTGWPDFLTGCIPPQTLLSFDDGCTLNESLDGGDTYVAVPGWVENFSDCVQKYTPIIGLPPNPGDKTPDQLACAIAAYLAEQVIIAAMGKAVTAVSDDLTLLQFGLDVVNIIPEFVLVGLAADAFSAYYVAVSEGTLSDFEDALTSAPLLAALTCAIYDCIVDDGYVKPANFPCIVTNVEAITGQPSDVIAAIVSYLNAIGAVGLAQLSQVAGLHTGEDCDACAGSGWCYTWDFTVETDHWIAGVPSFPAIWTTGVGWVGTYVASSSPPATIADIEVDLLMPDVQSIEVFYTTGADAGGAAREIIAFPVAGGTLTEALDNGTHTSPIASELVLNDDLNRIYIALRTAGVDTGTVITRVTIRGQGTNPFGTSNCL